MKLLKIKVKGLKLFRDELEVDFFAQQRVGAEKNEMLYKLSTNIYLNNVLAFIGINASGKTTVLKVISFVIQMLSNKPINSIEYNDILNGIDEMDKIVLETYFCCQSSTVNKLVTVIKKDPMCKDGDNKYIIEDEKIWSKDLNKVRTKKSLFEFEDLEPLQIRKGDEEYLMEDVSIIIAFNKKHNSNFYMRDLIEWTNRNMLNIGGKYPAELMTFLDPSIEYLNFERVENGIKTRLKFKEKEEIVVRTPFDLDKYLSSGTIRGINVFLNAMSVFDNGGYLLVDELENHFNKEIVSTLIRFFMNHEVNGKGATIVFSTHYPELLDEFERNDDIYIVRNKKGISAENLSKILTRNDIKKSEAYQSGYLQGTVPIYEAYIDLKNAIIVNSKIDEVQ